MPIIVSSGPAGREEAGWIEQAEACFETDFARSVECYSRALGLNPFSAACRFNRGRRYLSLDRFAEAKADMALAVRLDGRDRTQWHYLAVAEFFLEEYDACMPHLRRALELDLKDGVELVPSEADWMWMARMEAGDRDGARRCLELVDENTPVDAGNRAYKSRALLCRGLLSPEEYAKTFDSEDRLDSLTRLFGLVNYYRYVEPDAAIARACAEKALTYSEYPHAFAYKMADRFLRKSHC